MTMNWHTYVREHLPPLPCDAARETTIVDEIASQLQDIYDGALRAGASPDEAAARARSEVSDWPALARDLLQARYPVSAQPRTLAQHTLSTAAQRVPPGSRAHAWLSDVHRGLLADARVALRRLRQQPGFSSVAVLTLALGLGANAAIFTLLHAVMLRPLPVERPSELYRLGNTRACCVHAGLQREYSLFSTALFDHLHGELGEFRELAAFQVDATPTAMRPPGEAPVVSPLASYVTANYFDMLGVRPAVGRLMQPADDQAGATPAMVISFRTWIEQFGGDPSIVGRTFLINGIAVTLVGVAERGFFGETVRVDPAGVWLPLGQEPVLRGPTSLRDRPAQNWLYAIGRVRPGASPEVIGARATVALQSWLGAQVFLSENERAQLADQRIVVTSAASGVQLLRGSFGWSLTLLLAMSGVVLLIAIANLANLLLSRADRAPTAIRAAVGAAPARLLRQSLVEGLVLSLLGCVAALVVAVLTTRMIVALAFPPTVVVPVDLGLSSTTLIFTLALAVVTGVAFAAAPAWATARVDPIEALRGLAREGADVAFMPRQSFVVVQVALSFALLVCAGLLTRSLVQLEGQPLGFQPEQRLVVYVDVPASLADEPARLAATYATMLQRLEQLPGVRRATYALYSPMEGNNFSGPIAIAGRPVNDEARDFSSVNRVGPDYFDVIGTRVLRGRAMVVTDTQTSEHIAVVNLAFAQRFFPGADPVGQRLGIGGAEQALDYLIVGVVEDVKYSRPREPALPMIFLPAVQRATYEGGSVGQQMQTATTLVRMVGLEVTARAGTLEPAIRRALAEAHPDLTVTAVTPMHVQIAGNFRTERLLAHLAGAYGVLALLLAALGLYGVLAYGVRRRQHEIGVRMALGADRARIVRGILRGALLQVAIGVALGLPLAFAAARLLAAQLYDVTVRDPFVFAFAVVVLLVTTCLAATLPARRAASVDPSRALRAQ